MVKLSKDSEMPYIYIGLSRRYLGPASNAGACEVLSVSYPRLPLLWQLILMWRRLFARRRHVSTIGYRPLSVNFSI